jgi:hypothetical protein
MSYTQTDLDNLDAAIASGHRVVHVEGRRVEYGTTDELLKARSHVASQLSAAAAGIGGASRRGVFRFRNVTVRGD